MREWPLILFTLAIQLSCGLAMAATVFDLEAGAPDRALMRPMAMAIFPVIAAGILASAAHLGRPLLWWRALGNVKRSPLSLEAALTAVFALLAASYSGLWWLGRVEGRAVLGCVTSAAGVAAVASAARIYRIPSQAAWNSGWVAVSFVGATALLGGLAPALLLEPPKSTALLRALLAGVAAGSALVSIAAFWMLAHLSHRRQDPFESARLGTARRTLRSKGNALSLACHLALAGAVPAAISIRLWPEQSGGIHVPPAVVFAAVALGVAMGRGVMYSLGNCE